jgi:secreted trypsin-like serine protease
VTFPESSGPGAQQETNKCRRRPLATPGTGTLFPSLGPGALTDFSTPPQGDSGGPLVCDGVLQGVDSFVIRECATRQYPDFFARVSLYVDWIQMVLRSAGGPGRLRVALPQANPLGTEAGSKP